MGLPWTDKNNVNIAINEFVNQFTINRNFDRLLENDKELQDQIDSGIATEIASDSEASSGIIETTAINPKQLKLSNGMYYLHIRDEKPTGTNGGNLVIGWNDRDLNTIKTNTLTDSSPLSTNQITLPAGTYKLKCNVVVYQLAGNNTGGQSQIYDVTNSTTLLYGLTTSDYAGYGSPSSTITGTFTLTGETIIKLQSWAQTNVTYGMGIAANNGNPEVYAEIEIWGIS